MGFGPLRHGHFGAPWRSATRRVALRGTHRARDARASSTDLRVGGESPVSGPIASGRFPHGDVVCLARGRPLLQLAGEGAGATSSSFGSSRPLLFRDAAGPHRPSGTVRVAHRRPTPSGVWTPSVSSRLPPAADLRVRVVGPGELEPPVPALRGCALGLQGTLRSARGRAGTDHLRVTRSGTVEPSLGMFHRCPSAPSGIDAAGRACPSGRARALRPIPPLRGRADR